MLIDQLITSRLDSIAQEQQAQAERERLHAQVKAEQLEKAFREWAGAAYGELEPYMSKITYVNDAGIPTGKVELKVEAQALGLCPALIRINDKAYEPRWGVAFDGCNSQPFRDFADFLIAARERLETWRAHKIEKLTKTITRLSESPENVEAAHAILVDLDSAAAERAMAERKRLEEEGRQLKERAQRERAAAEAYRQAYTTYWQRQLQIIERNEAHLAEWRTKLAGSFQVTDVTYGVVANEEDGETYATTEQVPTLGQDEHGYWRVINWRGGITLQKYIHVVAIDAPRTVEVGDNRLCCAVWVSDKQTYGVDHQCLDARPDEDTAALQEQIESGLTPLEPAPEFDEELLTRWRAAQIARAVHSGETDEIEF